MEAARSEGVKRTKALEEAFAAASRLPPEEQDSLAAAILAELEVDARWDESFSRSQDVLERVAAEALEEHRSGQTEELPPRGHV